MSIYYKWICHELKEQVCGNDFNASIKRATYPQALIAIGLLCAYGSWRGKEILLVDDTGEMYFLSTGWKSAGPEALSLSQDQCGCKQKWEMHSPHCFVGLLTEHLRAK